MKPITKGFLITAGILALVGALLLFCGLVGMDFGKSEYTTVEYTPEGDFTHISVEGSLCRVTLKESTDGTCRVTCLEEEKVTHAVAVEGDTLTIREVDEREWYHHIGIFWEEPTMEIALPQKQYDSLTLENHVGRVELPAGFTFGDCHIKTDTGGVMVEAKVTGSLQIKGATGRIALKGMEPETLVVKNNTGKITLTDIKAEKLTVENDTGDLYLERVEVLGEMRLATDTGDIRLADCDGGALYIETDTGDVTGTLLTPKQFDVAGDTGSIWVPQSTEGNPCQIRTDTGDVEIKIK